MSRVGQRGFTLLELLLSVAIIGAIAGLGAPVYQSFQVRNDLEIAANTLAQSARRASVLAAASEGDSVWGLQVASGQIVIFKGTSYAARDTDYDEISTLPSSITPSSLTEVTFAKMTGLPNATGTMTLTSVTGDTRNVVLNARGTVSY